MIIETLLFSWLDSTISVCVDLTIVTIDQFLELIKKLQEVIIG